MRSSQHCWPWMLAWVQVNLVVVCRTLLRIVHDAFLTHKSSDTYSLPLPKNLPPTFKGRTFRFSYEFTIGVCRAGTSPGNRSANHSRIMKIPVRVYNNVNGQRRLRECFFATDRFFCPVMDPPTPYDLLWPVQCARSPHQVAKPTIVEDPKASKNPFQPKFSSRETHLGEIAKPY